MTTPDESPRLLEVENLRKSFVTKRNLWGAPSERTDAVKGVSFTLEHGQTIGIVGETGAGKSTVGRMALRLIEPDSGSIRFAGQDLLSLRPKELRAWRARAQMIFQDPFSSLDPLMTIHDTLAEPLKWHRKLSGSSLDSRIEELMRDVGMRPDQLDRYPREFSGGQLQRIAIARALATDPDLIVCDEPVAALDVSIQAQVLNVLLDLQQERGLSFLFITHDLALVRVLAQQLVVMRHGEVVEYGPTEAVMEDPREEYTRRLLAAIPHPRPNRQRPAARETVEVA